MHQQGERTQHVALGVVSIVFATHATSLDNEVEIASGHADVDLSDLGRTQAAELGQRYANAQPAAVYCSDLRRSYSTAEIAFGSGGIPILRDRRLRECDYGRLTRFPADVIESVRAMHVTRPFPGGESYDDATARLRAVLADILAAHSGQKILIIGHRATYYGLEHLLNGVPLRDAVAADWSWQPEWTYELAQSQHDSVL